MTDDGFSPDETRTLEALLETIVPPRADGRLPGAGGLGVLDQVARSVRQTAMLRPAIEFGLSALADLAAKRTPAGFAALGADERKAVLDELVETAGMVLPALLFLAYSSYYRHERVLEALGLEPRPPHPGGYEMAEDDWALLEPVRRRGRMYREG